MIECSKHKDLALTGKRKLQHNSDKQMQMEMASIYTTLKEKCPSSTVMTGLENGHNCILSMCTIMLSSPPPHTHTLPPWSRCPCMLFCSLYTPHQRL